MRVRCNTKTYTVDLRRSRSAPSGLDFSYSLIVGKDYLVIGLSFLIGSDSYGDGVLYDIVDEYERLMPIPSVLFEIVDPRVSSLWVGQELDSDQFVFRHPQFLSPYFYDQLSDGDPESIKLFEYVLEEMNSEEKAVIPRKS